MVSVDKNTFLKQDTTVLFCFLKKSWCQCILFCILVVNYSSRGLVVGWEKMLVNLGNICPVVNLRARRCYETECCWGDHRKHWQVFMNTLRMERKLTFPFPICILLHGCGCCGGQSKWMGVMVRRRRDSCLMTLVAFSPDTVAKQANTSVIRRERLCNLRHTQRQYNKLEFMRHCRLCHTFSVMSFAYVYPW